MRFAARLQSIFTTSRTSLIHRLDPRVKVFWFVTTTILAMALQNPLCLLILFLGTFTYSLLSKTVREHLAIFKFALFFSAVSFLLMLTATRDLAYLGELMGRIFARLLILTSAGILFALTTSPRDLVGMLENLRVPRLFTFPLTVAIRFVPTLIKELGEILDALRLRGVETGFRTLLHRPRPVYRGIFIPITIRSIAISDELAAAAETRGFGSPVRRTSLREERIRRTDYVFLLIVAFLSVALTLSDHIVRGGMW